MVRLQDIQDILEGRNKRSDAGSTVTALTVGAAMGAVAGVLLAPRSGKETRDRIMQKTSRSIDDKKEKIENARDKTQEKVDQAADVATTAADQEKQMVKDAQRRSNNAKR